MCVRAPRKSASVSAGRIRWIIVPIAPSMYIIRRWSVRSRYACTSVFKAGRAHAGRHEQADDEGEERTHDVGGMSALPRDSTGKQGDAPKSALFARLSAAQRRVSSSASPESATAFGVRRSAFRACNGVS